MYPSPRLAPKNSPTTTPRTARPMASRNPATTYGSAPGSTTILATCQELPPNERTTLTSTRSAFRTPSYVFTSSGNTAPRNTISTFDQIPRPNHRMSSGSHTIIALGRLGAVGYTAAEISPASGLLRASTTARPRRPTIISGGGSVPPNPAVANPRASAAAYQ